MVNRSPTSNFQLRSCRVKNINNNFSKANMAPIKPGRVTRSDKGRADSTRNPAPGSKSAQKKKKVRCSKCTDLHFPPTGRNCNRQPPPQNLSSTLIHEPETEPEVTDRVSPTISPVRTEGIPPNVLAGQSHAASSNMPTLQQQMDAVNRMSHAFTGYNPPASPEGNIPPSYQPPHSMAGPGLIGQNTHNLAPPPYVSPLAQVSSAPAAAYGPRPAGPNVQDQLIAANRLIQQLQAAAVTGPNHNSVGGPSGLDLTPPLNPTPPPPAPNPTRDAVIDKCLQRIMDTVADLSDRERERTEQENNMHRQNISNHNVLSPRVEDEEHQLANMSHRSDNFAQRVHQHRRAEEAAPRDQPASTTTQIRWSRIA